MRKLLIKPHFLMGIQVGLRVGWRIPTAEGGEFESWWGSTKNEETLKSLLQDLSENHGQDFDVERIDC